MNPIKIGTIVIPPSITIDYPEGWGPGCIRNVGPIPPELLLSMEELVEKNGWCNVKPFGSCDDITAVNGAAFCHNDLDYGHVAIALIDYPCCMETELVTCHGGTKMQLGDVVIFDSLVWHAWIAHGYAALAAMCVAPIGELQP